MKPLATVIIPVLWLAACDSAKEPVGTGTGTVTQTIEEPMPDKRPHELTIHGHTRVDEYYWLRDDSMSDPEILAYLEEENGHFNQVMAQIQPLEDAIFEEIKSRIIPDDASLPFLFNGYWYYARFEPGSEYAIHARRKGSMDAAEEILFDENERAESDGFYELRAMEISDDHRYIVLAEDRVGRRQNVLSILDTDSGEFLAETITNASDSLAWSADGRYLFYHDLDPQTLLDSRVMRHQLGTDAAEDVLVYEEEDTRFYSSVYRSRSLEYIFLLHVSTESTEVQILPADSPLDRFRPFLPREPRHEYSIDHAGGRFFIRTNWEAPNFRVMTTSQSGDKALWTDFIPGRDDALVIELVAFDDYLVVQERKDTLTRLRLMSHDRALDRYLEGEETVFWMRPAQNVSTATTKFRYRYSSYITPDQVWEVDMASGETTLLKADRVPGDFNSDHYRQKRIHIEARDGQSVPVSLVWHRDFEPSPTSPVLIDGYGAYGWSQDPWFYGPVFSLLDRGFVYAVAHIRGGQERGREWYEQGRMLNKKNTFFDFIDATRSLQQQGLADPKRTFAWGVSAGGLLMGAVLNMAPELYLGAIVDVPFVDVITTMLDDSIPLTSGEWREWGDPRIREEYDYMLSYSPYDQITEQDYPNIFVTTGLYDSQVQYFEPAKWVARLRDRRTDDNQLIFRVNMDAGHAGESGRYRQQRETAQEYAFMADLAGIEN